MGGSSKWPQLDPQKILDAQIFHGSQEEMKRQSSEMEGLSFLRQDRGQFRIPMGGRNGIFTY